MSDAARNTSGLSEQQEAFLDWLVDPSTRQVNESQNRFAVRLGVHQGTLSKWKKDSTFRKEWERRLAEANVSPDKLQKLMENTYSLANHEDVRPADRIKATELYMRLVDRMTPDKTLVVRDTPAADLSQDELEAQLEEQLAALRRSKFKSA